MELDQGSDELHRGFARCAGIVLQAPGRDLKDTGPLIPRQCRNAGVRRQARECLQDAVAHPDALVERAGEERFQQVLLGCRCNGEVRHWRVLVLFDDLLILHDGGGLALLALRTLGVLLASRAAAVAVRAARQFAALGGEQRAHALDNGAPQRVAVDVEERQQHRDVRQHDVRQALGDCDQELGERALERTLRGELARVAVPGELHQEEAGQGRGVREQQGVGRERRPGFDATQAVHQLRNGGHEQVRVLVSLLQKRLGDAAQGQLPRLAVLQGLAAVEDVEACVGYALGNGLP
mmetsp:Transcript_155090/g.497261  ORF Transcript_155090/g.497261 Transcript_155090/m.497261 type:complete len:294 (-) Transcript_155090:730-1611(-)